MKINHENLKKLRKKHGMTTYRMAEKLGVSQSSVSKWERGEQEPHRRNVYKICSAFNVDMSYLTGPQKPLESFKADPLSRKYKPDKKKVAENLAKLNGDDQMIEVNFGTVSVKSVQQVIKKQETELRGLRCELEGLKVENARLQGVIQGMEIRTLDLEPTSESSTDTKTKESLFKRLFW